MLKKLIGTKEFYSYVIKLTLPIMIQNGITNFVNMLDNVMVGQVGTMQMAGVSIANQLIFVFNLMIFGVISGAGIFGAQYHGKSDHEGVRNTFRFKLVFCTILTALGIAVFYFFGPQLINLYLTGEGSAEDAAASMKYGLEYLNIMLIGILPYSIAQCFASTLRETGKTVPPMIASTCAVFINLVLNYVFIFGKFGVPALGAAGAAIATVISRFVELAIVVLYVIINKKNNPFIIGAFRSMRVPLDLVRKITVKGMPLMLNETLWATGIAFLNQSYSARGLDVVPASNISQTFWNVFAVAFMSVGMTIGIIIGQQLGAGEHEKAKTQSLQLIAFSVFVAVIFGAAYIIAAEFIPYIYNTEDHIRTLATRMMQITALSMPLDAFAHATYFTLRSGGKVMLTFMFDCGFVWVINIPVVLLLTYCTSLPILAIFAVSHSLYIIKCFLGAYFVKKGDWVQNIVGG